VRGLLLTLLLCAVPATGLAADLEGRVILAGGTESPEGLEVELLGMSQDGEFATRTARTDDAGGFLFRDVQVPALYLVRAEYDGVHFSGPRVTFHPGEEDQTKSIEIEVYERSEDAAGVSLVTARWLLERGEAGSYRVQQAALIRNPADRAVVLPDDAPPALRIPLFPGHSEVRTEMGPLPRGFQLGASEVELRGPIYPGDGEIELSYEIDTGSRDLKTELRIPEPLERLDIYVRDVGIRVDAGPLHPARAVRDGHDFYQHYAGFELEAGTRIPLHIRSLPEPRPPAAWPRFLVAALLAGGCVLFVGWPVTRRAEGTEDESEDPEAAEKQRLFAALEDLEHDYETGKLTTEDHDRLREELRSDTLSVLARMRGAQAEPEPADERRCSCGRPLRPDDRFCSGCGRPV
jgi:hypothetical protein